ncbi:hypothetical protein D3C85_1435440 [compost metagenome]
MLHAHVGYLTGDEQVDPNWRSDHSYRQVDHHDAGEVDRVDAELGGGRGEDRREDDDRRQGLEEHADQKQCHVDNQQEHQRIVRDTGDQRAEHVRHAVDGQHVGKDRGEGNDDQDDRGGQC